MQHRSHLFRIELRTDKGFQWESWAQAAQWCVDKNTNLEQALLWADTAVSVNFGGDRSFQTWSTKAQVLDKLGRGAEAADIMKKRFRMEIYSSFINMAGNCYSRKIAGSTRGF